MENYHTTKDQQFRQEEKQMSNAMDKAAAKRQAKKDAAEKKERDFDMMLQTLKEIASDYPEQMTYEQAALLCWYVIGKARSALLIMTNP